MQGTGKRFVYILRSGSDPTRHYVGLTSDVAKRLVWHNGPGAGHTGSGRPWVVVVAIEFRREADAFHFERYLKSGSGRAFAKRHFAAGDLSVVDGAEITLGCVNPKSVAA